MKNVDAYGRILHVGDIITYISNPSRDYRSMKMGMILSISPDERKIVVRPTPTSFKKPSKSRKVILNCCWKRRMAFEKDLERYVFYGDPEIKEAIKEYEKETGHKWLRTSEDEEVWAWNRVIRAISYDKVSDPSIYID